MEIPERNLFVKSLLQQIRKFFQICLGILVPHFF